MAAFFASLPSWLQAAAMAQSPASVVNPAPLYPGGGRSGEGAGMLGGVGGGPQVSSALVSLGGVAGLVGAVGGVTSDVFGVGSSGPDHGAGSG